MGIRGREREWEKHLNVGKDTNPDENAESNHVLRNDNMHTC